MKKILIAVLLLLSICMSMVGMTACGGAKAQPNFEVPEGGYDGSAVTITFYTTMGTNLTPVLETYIAEFNKLYPNITVDLLWCRAMLWIYKSSAKSIAMPKLRL